ncbi:MAG: Uma2 family endonuclease [Acidobacteria bacterium]|nr:Uma2 family endonuclease [Acidobacteriota bacterium]
MRATNPAGRLTYDDFVHFPEDDGLRHELIDGEHYVTAAPNVRHQDILGSVHFLIRTWLEDHPAGRVFFAPFDVVISRFDVVEPDLVYMSHERAAAILTKANAQGVPELVVEIASESTRRRDATIKRRLYERSGVSEYWTIDPDTQTIRVQRRVRDRFVEAAVLALDAGDVLTTPLLPGLQMPLGRIFRD